MMSKNVLVMIGSKQDLEGKRSRVSEVANLPYYIDDKRRAGIDAGGTRFICFS
jgi:hypothetical protein